MEHDIVFLCETMTRNMIDAPGSTVFTGNNSTTGFVCLSYQMWYLEVAIFPRRIPRIMTNSVSQTLWENVSSNLNVIAFCSATLILDLGPRYKF